MLILSHPTGNANVRQVLQALREEEVLGLFATTVGLSGRPAWLGCLPLNWRQELMRRSYDVPQACLSCQPWREMVRLLALKAGIRSWVRHEKGWASIDAVIRAFDRKVAERIQANPRRWRAVYASEDSAARTFCAAKANGMTTFYDLPIAYWETSRRHMLDEAIRYPAWTPTLLGDRDSLEKLESKSAELDLADVVICPSEFVVRSLPEGAVRAKTIVLAPFGSPPIAEKGPVSRGNAGSLRVLFAGSLTQRKGLADVFAALSLLGGRPDVELVVMGSLLQPLEFYRSQGVPFRYEPPRPHGAVLELMRTCDVLVLPSIVEGRALVLQEAMSQGLPLIITPNTGGEDLIDEGETGFLVPIRRPDLIAEKISWLADHREACREMGRAAQHKGALVSWSSYRAIIRATVRSQLALPR